MSTHIVFNSVNRRDFNNTSSSNCEIVLNKSVFAKCAELSYFQAPNTFYNVTSKNNTFLLNSATISITSGCYSLNDLFTEILSVLPVGSTLLYNEVTNQCELTFLAPATLDLTVGRFHLLLGFKKKIYGPATNFISEHCPKIYQSYIFIQSSLSSNIVNDLGYHSTFCIPIQSNRGEMITFYNRTQFSSRPKVHDTNIHSIKFVLKDEYDEVLEGAGDFSLILQVVENI